MRENWTPSKEKRTRIQSLNYKFSMKMNYLTCLLISVTFKVKHLPREEYGNVFPESAYLNDTFKRINRLSEFTNKKQTKAIYSFNRRVVVLISNIYPRGDWLYVLYARKCGILATTLGFWRKWNFISYQDSEASAMFRNKMKSSKEIVNVYSSTQGSKGWRKDFQCLRHF